MPVVAKRFYRHVRPGDVYPTAFNAGDELPDWAAETALAEGAAEMAGSVGAAAAQPAATHAPPPPADGATAPRVITAKTLRRCELEIEGRVQKFAAKATVYGEVAQMLIDAGHAVEVRAADGAPETK